MTTQQADTIFNIESIGTANFYTEKAQPNDFLYLLILTSTRSDWEKIELENIPFERYADNLESWQVFDNEIIVTILEEFHQLSTINLRAYFIDKQVISQENLEDVIEPLTKNFILIIDAFSLLFDENQNFARLFDSKDKNKIGGCIVPIGSENSEKQLIFAKEQVHHTFKRLAVAWQAEFYKSYTHVELDVPNKVHFFRRLANIAYLKGITEKETMTKIELKSTQFKQPPLDNLKL
ncbi:MAG: hypothetical protein MUE85_11845 [Microscillaceae bacterium]|jgi:hypothetical protein|nr:hypothetical protein [Microscillaceae bacterium]